MDHDPRTYAIIGATMEVHRQLGCGFLEAVYQEALAIKLAERGIPFRAQVELPVYYKSRRLESYYRVDFIGYEAVVVEVKALSCMGRVEDAQILNYLKATGYEIGLLLNFRRQSLEYKRMIRSKFSADFPEDAD